MRVLVLTMVVFGVGAMQNAGNCSEDRVLSRRRRYLIFPDGSSLQLVYDQIIPIVDYTNLVIMGVTVALAWRLPDQPDFREKTESEENRKTFQINRKQGVNTKTANAEHQRPYYMHNDRKHYHDHRINVEYQNYLVEKSKQEQQSYTTSDWNKAKWLAVPDNGKNKFRHRIYPVLLKRRAIEQRDERHRHADYKRHTQHHRKTRFSLYQSIEKYLNARGHNGKQCIQLAICETAKRTGASLPSAASDDSPQSFLKELLRVIFSLPTTILESSPSNMTELYDAANNIDSADCAKAFPKCSNSIWSDDFIF